MSIAIPDIRLSAEARIALRKAITGHAKWDEVRRATGYSLANMTRVHYMDAAAKLGIDVRAIARETDEAEPVESNTRAVSEKAEKAASVFNDKPEPTYYGPDLKPVDAPLPNRRSHEIENSPTFKEGKITRNDAPKPADDNASRLAALLREMTGAAPVDENMVRDIVAREIERALIDNTPTLKIELVRADRTFKSIEGHKHPKFATLLRAAAARDANGYVPSVWLAGPAGSGKTKAASMVADALEVAFHYNGAISMPHELLGFIDAGGSYHRTPFRDAYENGGVYLFDEVDGSDNSALLALNAALANGMATFPDGQTTRHKDCVIIAAANTWGLGGTADYVGRSKIDAAFLSRFPVRIFWDYDAELETAISGNPDFAARVQRARAKAKSAGLKVLITPRDTQAGAALIAAGFSQQEAAELTFLANLSPEQRNMID